MGKVDCFVTEVGIQCLTRDDPKVMFLEERDKDP